MASKETKAGEALKKMYIDHARRNGKSVEKAAREGAKQARDAEKRYKERQK